MVERQEVEALLVDTEHKHRPMYVRNDTLAALCRAWLAVDGAPARDVVGQQWDDVFAREGNVVWCSDLHPGQRVRIVKEAREK